MNDEWPGGNVWPDVGPIGAPIVGVIESDAGDVFLRGGCEHATFELCLRSGGTVESYVWRCPTGEHWVKAPVG